VYLLAESREGIQQKLQDALEAERDDIVGRAGYERVGSPVDRNGYHMMRCQVYGCGTVLHAGYGSLYQRVKWESTAYVNADEFIETRRGFFFKMSYLWRF
jgi:hypothetical protein